MMVYSVHIMLLGVLSGALFVPFLIDALRRSGLATIEKEDLVIWCAMTVLMFGALSLSADMPEGVALQYSGSAFLAMTLGYCRALLSMTLLLLITQPLQSLGVLLWVDALLPVWLTVQLVGFSRHYLPANPFVFLLGCGFFGLFVVYALEVLVGSAVSGLIGGVSAGTQTLSETVVWGLMLAAGEATLEGMIITTLVVYCPRAVALFDDRFYLFKRF